MSKDLIIFAIVAGIVLLLNNLIMVPGTARHSLVDQHRAMEFGVKP